MIDAALNRIAITRVEGAMSKEDAGDIAMLFSDNAILGDGRSCAAVNVWQGWIAASNRATNNLTTADISTLGTAVWCGR